MLCSFLLVLSLFSVEARATTLKTSTNIHGSKDIKGMVLIESPKVGALLQLRGMVGKGRLIVRTDDFQTCVSVPIRLAAGYFGGLNLGIEEIEQIQLVIYSDEIIKELISGEEVISENYRVTDQSEEKLGDIQINSGLTLDYGFVLNPGEWSWSSLFGQDQIKVECGWLNHRVLE
jgi:hypothetical protein